MDVLGYLGASSWRFLVGSCGCTWVFFAGVFLHCYFGMYLLRGISTLDAPIAPHGAVYSVYLSLFLNALCGALSSVFYTIVIINWTAR